jgi:hypothetical protein
MLRELVSLVKSILDCLDWNGLFWLVFTVSVDTVGSMYNIGRARVNQPPMTAPVGRSVHRIGWAG